MPRFRNRFAPLLLLGILPLVAWAEAPMGPDIEPAQPAPAAPLQRPTISGMEPMLPVQLPEPTPDERERQRLAQLQEVEEEEFSAPPFIVARISTLPIMRGDSTTQAVMRAERNLLKERARIADRLFRRGDTAEALALMGETERMLTSPALRSMALNRMAAYHFRVQEYDQTAVYARRAWDLDPSDTVSACNLAATLLTVGEVDEALDILLRIYGQVFSRPQLAFSVHFNLACAYSLKGESLKAFQNLVLAAQIDPIATYAAIGDTQLDSIREMPEFTRLRDALAQLIQTPAARKP